MILRVRGAAQPRRRRHCDPARGATGAPRFRVDVYRCGDGMERVHRTGWLSGRGRAAHLPWHDWGRPNTGLHGEPLAPWPAYPLDVDRGWRPGVYVAVLVEGDADGHDRTDPDRSTPDGRGRALFVVRPPAPAAPHPLQAAGPDLPRLRPGGRRAVRRRSGRPGSGASTTCRGPREVPIPFPPGLGLHRPGGGTGAPPTTSSTPTRSTPRPPDLRALGRQVRRAGWSATATTADYCTDVDLHRGGRDMLAPYRLLVSVGHDEYWSDAMRAAVEGYVERGGNVAFFSGNTCWWRVVFDDDVTFERLHFWHEPDRPGEPENAARGRQLPQRRGARPRRPSRARGVPGAARRPLGLRRHGRADGDVFGEPENLIGYECDGADFDRADLEAGRAVDAVRRRRDARRTTPSSRSATAGRAAGGSATARPRWGCSRRGGTVFTASTTDWARVLAAAGTPSSSRSRAPCSTGSAPRRRSSS